MEQNTDITITDEPMVNRPIIKIYSDLRTAPGRPARDIQGQILHELQAIRALLESTIGRPPLWVRIWQRIKQLCGIH